MNTIAAKWLEIEKRYYESKAEACQRLVIEHDLGISGKYLYQIAYHPDRYKASAKLRGKISTIVNGKRQYPPTITVRFSPEQEAERQMVLELSNDERRAALLKAAKERMG